MATNYYIFLLACSLLLTGCWGTAKTLENHAPEKEASLMILIEDVKLTDKTLTLDYDVSNALADDIWVCEAPCVFNCVRQATTRIDGETLWIEFRSKTERETDIIVLSDPPGIAKYLRLRPGESHSGIIVLDLPIMEVPSGIYSLTEERAKKRKQVVLHRAILEVGYFAPRYNRFFVDASAMAKEGLGIKDDDTSVVSPVFGLRIDPYVVDEIHEGKSRRVLYIGDNSPSRELEESAKVLITDVNIPCSVVVDDQ